MVVVVVGGEGAGVVDGKRGRWSWREETWRFVFIRDGEVGVGWGGVGWGDSFIRWEREE